MEDVAYDCKNEYEQWAIGVCCLEYNIGFVIAIFLAKLCKDKIPARSGCSATISEV
jgi:hypothetical protein